jgi:Na+/proline symporter
MTLHLIDWLIIGAYFAVSLAVGLAGYRKAGSSAAEFFASGRNMPWWLLGISMVATTFSADTPNLVTDMVRQHGVAGNWLWWAFLLTGMVTVFIYARLWRRSQVLTDIEFYELRYSGKSAAFLRGFRALYLGVFFNVVIMAAVLLAGIKIGGVMLGLTPVQTVLATSVITAVYTMIGGLQAVLLTDFIQFVIAMTGSILAAYVVVTLPQVGGLSGLLAHPDVAGKISVLPDFTDTSTLMAVFVVPLAVQWWSVWYPGAEPGGGGYIAQRMLAARNETHAMGATLLFNIAHYALRPWPWIIVALSSLIVFPDLASLRSAFPKVDPAIVRHDLAYPAMLTLLPAGWLGLVVASLLAAQMSTISTHLNWGSSYIVNDYYRRFVQPNLSEREQVMVGRMATVLLMTAAAVVALFLSHALQAFNILLQIGAGTGLLFLIRWFWWRVNAASEIAAMGISFAVAVYFQFVHSRLGLPAFSDWQKLVAGVALTTAGWILVTLLTEPSEQDRLLEFYRKVHPGGPGWKKVLQRAADRGEAVEEYMSRDWDVPDGLLRAFWGITLVYAALFATGFWLYSNIVPAALATVVALVSSLFLVRKGLRT